jgi:hypothetical protein
MDNIELSEKRLILFKDVRETMKAEQILKRKILGVKVVAPPPEVRVGCDLSIEINLVDSFGAEKTLRNHRVEPVKIISLGNTQQRPLDIVKEVDFGDFTMIKAGHMKLTFDKRNGEIVNISGGGCPDIPFLALNMVGKTLEETDKPEDLGYTLCAYMLQKAYEKATQVYEKSHPC